MKVFICSPYRGDVEKNLELARKMCRIAYLWKHTPVAPHLYYPQFLDDNNPEEREWGMQRALRELSQCDVVYVPRGVMPSEGMGEELRNARMWRIPIVEVDIE